jgi:hypothetical protein
VVSLFDLIVMKKRENLSCIYRPFVFFFLFIFVAGFLEIETIWRLLLIRKRSLVSIVLIARQDCQEKTKESLLVFVVVLLLFICKQNSLMISDAQIVAVKIIEIHKNNKESWKFF